MASALPGSICLGQHSVCLIRLARLNADCTPAGGEDGGIITTGIVTATASPEILEGNSFEPTNGCGDIAWTYRVRDRIRGYNINGELTFFDPEAMEVMFGGDLIVGGAGSDFVGDNIGWAAPNYTDDPPNPVFLELITKTAGEGVGECSNPVDPFPTYTGHIFGKAQLVPGDRTFENDAATLAFTGFNEANPNLGDGPWNDWNGVGNMPNKPYFYTSYSSAEYQAMLDLAACGYQTLPSQST